MTSAEQAGEPIRDFSSPATWGDVEQVRLSLRGQLHTQHAEAKAQVAQVDSRLEKEVAAVRIQVAEVQAQMAQLETRVEKQIAGLETRLIRWSAGLAAAAGVAIIGFLVGILQAVD